MRRAYVFRLRPTARQHIALNACVDAHREIYNAALQERREAWSRSKNPDPLWGSIRAADRYPVSALGSGGVVLLEPASDSAPPEQSI